MRLGYSDTFSDDQTKVKAEAQAVCLAFQFLVDNMSLCVFFTIERGGAWRTTLGAWRMLQGPPSMVPSAPAKRPSSGAMRFGPARKTSEHCETFCILHFTFVGNILVVVLGFTFLTCWLIVV